MRSTFLYWPRAAFLLLTLSHSAFSQSDCDRACLESILATYMTAIAANDPAQAPLASIYR